MYVDVRTSENYLCVCNNKSIIWKIYRNCGVSVMSLKGEKGEWWWERKEEIREDTRSAAVSWRKCSGNAFQKGILSIIYHHLFYQCMVAEWLESIPPFILKGAKNISFGQLLRKLSIWSPRKAPTSRVRHMDWCTFQLSLSYAVLENRKIMENEYKLYK